jgi:hypothetical protein
MSTATGKTFLVGTISLPVAKLRIRLDCQNHEYDALPLRML